MRNGEKKVRRYFEAVDDLLKTDKTMKSIYKICGRFSANVASEYAGKDGRITRVTYNQYFDSIYKTASIISKRLEGIDKGSIVGLKIKNSPVWGVFFWALLMSGYCPMMLDARADIESAKSLLEKAGGRAVITEETDGYPCLAIKPYELSYGNAAAVFTPHWENRVLFCTSGTTGESKIFVFDGECLTYQIASARSMPDRTLDIMYPPSMGNLKILAMLPFHHIFGFVAVFLWYTFFGKTLVFLDDLLPEKILETCRRQRVSHVYSVPLLWNGMAQTLMRRAVLSGKKREDLFQRFIAYNTNTVSKRKAGYGASRMLKKMIQKKLLGQEIKYCISGGGHISADTLRIINGVGYPLYNGYGMTEVGVTSVELDADVKNRLKGSIGRPLYLIEYKIEPAPGCEEGLGELYIKSKTTHIGTMENGAFKKRPDSEWLRTGDIASKDAEGNYYIKGRLKDVIINADGENVFPDELEARFAGLPLVSQYSVFGISRGSEPERITLVLKLSKEPSEEEKEQLCDAFREINGALPMHKQVQDVYISTEALPVVNMIKVQRYRLREKLTRNDGSFIRLNVLEGKDFKNYPKEYIEKTLSGVRSCFARILNLPEEKVLDNGHFVYDLGGDSLLYAGLILEIERHFNISIPQQDYGKYFTVYDFTGLVAGLQKADSDINVK